MNWNNEANSCSATKPWVTPRIAESCHRHMSICIGAEQRWDGFKQPIKPSEKISNSNSKRNARNSEEREIEEYLTVSAAPNGPFIQYAVYKIVSETEGWYHIAVCQWIENNEPAPAGKVWVIEKYLYIPLCLKTLVKEGITVINVPLPVPVLKKPKPGHRRLSLLARAPLIFETDIPKLPRLTEESMVDVEKAIGMYWNQSPDEESAIRGTLPPLTLLPYGSTAPPSPTYITKNLDEILTKIETDKKNRRTSKLSLNSNGSFTSSELSSSSSSKSESSSSSSSTESIPTFPNLRGPGVIQSKRLQVEEPGIRKSLQSQPKLAAPYLPTPSISPDRFHPYPRDNAHAPRAGVERTIRRQARGYSSISPPTPESKLASNGTGREYRSPSPGRITLKFKDGRYISPPPTPAPEPQVSKRHCPHRPSRLSVTTSALEPLTPEPDNQRSYKAGRVLPAPQDRDTLSPEPNL